MKVNFDFIVDAWIKGVELEGNSLEDCKEQLLSMSLEDLISEGYIKDFEIKEINEDVVEDIKTITVKVTNITYDISDEDIEDTDFSITKDDILKTLPKSMILDLDVGPDDNLENLITEAIYDKTSWPVNNFKYNILK